TPPRRPGLPRSGRGPCPCHPGGGLASPATGTGLRFHLRRRDLLHGRLLPARRRADVRPGVGRTAGRGQAGCPCDGPPAPAHAAVPAVAEPGQLGLDRRLRSLAAARLCRGEAVAPAGNRIVSPATKPPRSGTDRLAPYGYATAI